MVQFTDLKIGNKQKGFELQIGWVHLLYIRLGCKFRLELHLHNNA